MQIFLITQKWASETVTPDDSHMVFCLHPKIECVMSQSQNACLSHLSSIPISQVHYIYDLYGILT